MLEAPPLSKLIWISVNPIVQLLLVGGIGVWLARKNILTTNGAKIMSQVYIQALVPCLMFSKMSVAVTNEALQRMAVVIPFVLLYMGIGLVGGILLRIIFKNKLPSEFNYAIIVASTWSNWGDIPLAVILNFTSLPPFEPSDGDLGVAYVSVFLVIFTVTLFPLGGHKFIEKDFISLKSKEESDSISDNINSGEEFEHYSNRPNDSTNMHSNNTLHGDDLKTNLKAKLYSLFYSTLTFLMSLITPVNVGIILGLIVGLTPLKPIFIASNNNPYNVVGVSPPLHVIYTTTQFLGGACIPVGLLNLGAALSSLEIRSIPINLSLFMAFIKLIITPLIGIPLVYLSVNLGWIGKEEKVLQLVLMFASSVPSASTALILTQYYNPLGEAKHISSLLVIQYLLGFFTMIIALSISNFLIFS